MAVAAPKIGDGEVYELRASPHDPEVAAWRRDQFVRLGFDDARAEFLARQPSEEADLGEARRLIGALGYSPEQAWVLL